MPETAPASRIGVPSIDYSVPSADETITGRKTFAAPTAVSDWGGFFHGVFHRINVDDGFNPDFNFVVSSNAINGADPRPDVIVQLGWNCAPGSVSDPTEPAFSDNWESYYISNGIPVFERHIGQVITPGGAVIRPFGFAVARDGSSAGHSYRGSKYEWLDITDASQHLAWVPGSSFQILKTNYFLHNTNNVKWLRQYPFGASTEVSLIYLDASNVHQVGNAGFAVNFPGTAATFAGGIKLTGTIGLINGDTLVTTQGMRVNGTLWIGNGSDYITQNGTGTLATSNDLRVGGAIVTNQSQVANPVLAVHRIRPSASQTGMLTAWENSGGSTLSGVRPDGGIKPAAIADSSATNDSIYYSSTQAKLAYKDPGGIISPLSRILTATAILDFPSLPANSTGELTLTVVGAAVNDAVTVGPPAALESGLVVSPRVSAADTVTIRLANVTGSAIDPASGTYRATVIKP